MKFGKRKTPNTISVSWVHANISKAVAIQVRLPRKYQYTSSAIALSCDIIDGWDFMLLKTE